MCEFTGQTTTFQQCVFGILKFLEFHENSIQKRRHEKVGLNAVVFHPFWGPNRPKRKRCRRNLFFDPKRHMARFIIVYYGIYTSFLLIFRLIDHFSKMSRNGASGSRKPSINDGQTRVSGPWGHFRSFLFIFG